MDQFKNRFWRHLKHDTAARDAMEKIPSASHNRVVRLLEVVTNPATDGRFRDFAHDVADMFVPSEKGLAGLANRLKTLGRDLENVAKFPGFILGADKVLEFAKRCDFHARYLSILKPTRFARHLRYKSFWKCIPAAMLCRELVDSKTLSFLEVENLVRCADGARGRSLARPKRSVERQYKGLMKYGIRDASPLLIAAWPIWLQGLLDVLLRTVPTR
jgi:hypothetical protein